MKAINIENLTKSYGKDRGIDDISFNVEKGDIVGFIGPNGAGKSTTIKILLNMIFKTEGKAEILEQDCEKCGKDIKAKVGYVPSEVKFYDEVKVKDIIKYSKSFYKTIDNEKLEKMCNELKIDLNKRMKDLSLGNKKKVAIVQALLHSPEVVILDEPTNGLDPLIQKKLFELLLEENKEGKTIFLSSHNLNEVQQYCNKVVIIKEGKIVDIKDMSKFKNIKAKRIKVKGNIKEVHVKELGGENIKCEGNEISFMYQKEINKLIRILGQYEIEDLEIKEEELSEVFMHYYEGEE